MKKFSELLNEKKSNFRERKRSQYEALICFISTPEDKKNDIDSLFEDSIEKQSTRAEIIPKLNQIFEKYKNEIQDIDNLTITPDSLYDIALQTLAPQKITEGETTFIIGKRRGPNGGFEKTEINYSPADYEKNQEDPKALEDAIDQNKIQIEKAEVQERMLEKHYYPYVQKWAQENGFERCEITGGLIPGPKWENPDLIEMYFDAGINTQQLNIEVTSFEVKLRIDPQGIWQAAHYSRFSHFTFIAFALTEEEVRSTDRVFELAVKFGIGVLVLESKDQGEIKFKLIHSPTKNNPPNSEIETIVSRFLVHEKINDRFSSAKNQLAEEKKKLSHQLLSGINLTIGVLQK